MKNAFILLCLMLLNFSTKAQDTIFKKDHSRILCHVSYVGEMGIVCETNTSKCDTFLVFINEVSTVQYQHGGKDIFYWPDPVKSVAPEPDDNVLSFTSKCEGLPIKQHNTVTLLGLLKFTCASVGIVNAIKAEHYDKILPIIFPTTPKPAIHQPF